MKIFSNEDEIYAEAGRQLRKLVPRIREKIKEEIKGIDRQEIKNRLWGIEAVEGLVCDAACTAAKESL